MIYNGAFDGRTDQQKEREFTIRELAGSVAAPVVLVPTSPDKWKIYPKRDQDGSNSCTYQARAKAAGILRELVDGQFVEYSAADYQKRSNAPAVGSSPFEAFDFWRKEGIGIESIERSQNMDDAGFKKQTPFAKEVAKISTIEAYYTTPLRDFDSIVTTLSKTKKGVPIGFFGTVEEWSKDVPRIGGQLTPDQAAVRHLVCATPNVGVWQGEEGFTIEDSWGTAGIGGLGVRWITRSFFSQRNYIQPIIPANFKMIAGAVERPAYRFTRTLKLGMSGEDVAMLQKVLKYEGFFPIDHAGSDYFGGLTRTGVMDFQRRYKVASEAEIVSASGSVGNKTLSMLNVLYGQ